jgi:hypothetical protein
VPAAEASTTHPPANHVAKQPTNHDGLKAGVNFTPTVDLDALNNSDLFKYVCAACNGGGIVEAAVRNHREEAGRALSELFRRDQLARERGEDNVPTWEARCDSIPICRKTAYNLRQGHAAVRAADPLLKNAADERKIDLFQPQVNRRLVAITVKQEGRAITPYELPALINKLDPPDKTRVTKVSGTKGSGTARANSADASTSTTTRQTVDMDPDKTKWAPIPQTVEEVAELRAALASSADRKALSSDPFLLAFVTAPSRSPDDAVRKVVMEIVKMYPEVQVDDLVSWVLQGVNSARETRSRNHGESLNQQEPSPEPTADSAPPSSEPETAFSSESRPVFLEIGEAHKVEITGKPDFNALTGSSQRKPPARETFPEDFVDSLAAAGL